MGLAAVTVFAFKILSTEYSIFITERGKRKLANGKRNTKLQRIGEMKEKEAPPSGIFRSPVPTHLRTPTSSLTCV